MSPRSGHSEGSSLTEYLILSLVFALGVILTLIASINEGHLWAKVLSGLGDALVIAALVGTFVEMRLVSAALQRMEAVGAKAVDDIKGMVIKGLRKYLPPKLVDALEQQVLDPIFLREGMSIVIKLAHITERQLVQGNVFLKYHVKNLSATDQLFTVRVVLDEVFGDKSAMLLNAKINGQPVDLSVLPQGSKISREANTLKFEHPISIPAEGRIHVEVEGYQLMAEADVWPWHLMGVSDSVQITVIYPPEVLSVWLLPSHPISANMAEFGLTETKGTTQAAIKEIILPYQGFELRWKPPAPRQLA